ncbi:oligopeptide transporter [Planoprotostelium fungivorum]|uniref:Oligopeptide transporter n=1 Tax=Planoprotostelium fungivorum TaxID=1890364 RepID=A0A2P6N087_9EUKA|nr:oligopeptide transporter [Planoprotostelium fungivorum]
MPDNDSATANDEACATDVEMLPREVMRSSNTSDLPSLTTPEDVEEDEIEGKKDLTERELECLKAGLPLPEDPDATPETRHITIRAVIVGCILGTLVAASNIYLGLKTGFTFGPQLFGAIFGFAILKALSRTPLPLFGGYFGPKENCTVQTAATSTGGLGILFVSAIPACYQLGLLSTPKEDFWKLIALTAVCAYYGLFFAIPMRTFYILIQRLVFPTPTATALTIRQLHAGGKTGEAIAKKKAFVLGGSLIGSLVLRVVSQYAPGALWDWHIFWWLYTWGWKYIVAADCWGWYLEWTPAFIGSGMLVGLNPSISYFAGSFLAWGIIGPSIVARGLAFTRPASDIYPEIFTPYSMNLQDPVNAPSPRYWLLWPGVLMMFVSSTMEIIVNFKPIYQGFKTGIQSIINTYRERKGQEPKYVLKPIDDPAKPEDKVPTWAWMGGLLISVIATCAVISPLFHINVGTVILAVLLGFVFSFIGIQSSAVTDLNPISTIAKASQLIIGGVTKGQGITGPNAELTNLMAGVVSAGAAAQTVDMTGDLRTGHLLGAKPKVQFYAQIIGSFCSIWLCVGFFVLFATAYPCIIDINAETCQFGIPSVTAWRAVAIAVTQPNLPIPPSSGYTAIGLSVFCVILVLAKHFAPKKYKPFIPNANSIGLGFVVPQVTYSVAMVIGAVIDHVWGKKGKKSHQLFKYALAAGLVAGEGLGGVINAVFQIGKFSGDLYGSSIGCTGGDYCG